MQYAVCEVLLQVLVQCSGCLPCRLVELQTFRRSAVASFSRQSSQKCLGLESSKLTLPETTGSFLAVPYGTAALSEAEHLLDLTAGIMHIILENLCDSLHTCNHLIRVMLTYKYIKSRRVSRDAVLNRVCIVGYLGVRLRPSHWHRRGKPDCYMFTTSNVCVAITNTLD